MSDRPTPRTEAVMVDPLSDWNDLAQLARQLETELSEVLRERDEARELHKKSLCEREAAERESDATLERTHQAERERDEAGKELSSIHRWIERNHADGFIDSLTYLENLERVTDSWYDRIDAIETDARRFVRERDEARKIASELAIQAERLRKGRDEAREERNNLATEHMLAVNRLAEERDEAREMAQQLIHIASHCLGWHDNTNPETITDAINRWNASTKK